MNALAKCPKCHARNVLNLTDTETVYRCRNCGQPFKARISATPVPSPATLDETGITNDPIPLINPDPRRKKRAPLPPYP